MLRTRKLDVDQLINWRQRLLSSLNKLGERDTQKTASDELNKMIDELSEQTLPIFMSCLFETCDTQRQSARKEAIRIFANLATVHRDILQPYLPKIVASIAKRVRDNDSGTRDICSDTIGTLAKFITPPIKSSGDHPLEVYFKPLFQVLTEQNKNNQTGASTCISRVIENSVGYVTLNLSHLCNRILKHLSHPNFLAQPALLGALSQLVQTAGEYLIPHVPTFLGTLLDNLSSGDFPTRKASAEVLGVLAIRLGPAMIQFRDEILPVLDELRFDKVKPVREAAVVSVEAFKSLSSPGIPSLNDERPKTPSRRSTTPVRDRGRSASYGALPINTNKVVSHSIQFKAPPKFDLSFPASSTSLPPGPARPHYQTQNIPNQIPDIDSNIYDLEEEEEEEENNDYSSSSTLPHHSSSHSSIHSLASTNGIAHENGKHQYGNPQPQSLTLLKQGKQRNSLPQPLIPQNIQSQQQQQQQQQHSLSQNLQHMNLQSQSPHSHSPHNAPTQNQNYQNQYQNIPNQNQNFQNQSFHNQPNQPNQQNQYNQQNQQQNMYSSQQNLSDSQQNQPNAQYQTSSQQQKAPQNIYNFNQPYPPQFSADNSNWTQIAEQLAKLTETQIQFMNRVDNFMFETRRDLGSLSQRMADLEGVVEILYNSHQERVKEDVFDPLDTPNPPSHEPYDAALGYLSIGHVKAAYEKVVKSGDGLQLARLMEKTGPVIDKLDNPLLVELFGRIIQFVKTKAFLDSVFPWLWQSISLSKLPLEPPQLTSLMNALEDISVDPSKSGIEAAQILAQLKKLGLVWG